MGNYVVVLLQINEEAGMTGMVTWRDFINKKDFDEWNSPEKKNLFAVVREGVLRKEAIQIAMNAKTNIYYHIAIDQSRHKDGSINTQLLYAKLLNILYAEEHDFRQKE